MPYKKYSQETYEKYLSLSARADNDFGVSEDTLINWFVQQAGAKPVMNSYGVNADNLKTTYIPAIKEANISPQWFLMYTVTEGGGAGNWINHYMSDTSTTGLGCLKDDLQYLNGVLDTWYPVALSAPECYAATEDNEGACQAFYNSLPNGTIGDAYMPSTMAGNAWVWCYNYCHTHRGSAPLVYFGNPYDDHIATVESLGGNFDGIGTGSNDRNEGTGTGSGNNQQTTTVTVDMSAIREEVKKAIQDIFNRNIQSLSPMFASNGKITLQMIMNQLTKADINPDELQKIIDIIKDVTQTVTTGTGSESGSANGGGSGNNDTSPIEGVSEKVQNALNAVAGVIGQYIEGGQCYGLSSWYSRQICGLGTMFGYGDCLQAVGDTLNAHSIHLGWNWAAVGAKTKNYKGVTCPVSDLKVGAIWAMAAYQGGSFGTTQYGHTGIIKAINGDTVVVYEQNRLGHPVEENTYNATDFANTLDGLIWWE